jgi:hypothetical protein
VESAGAGINEALMRMQEEKEEAGFVKQLPCFRPEFAIIDRYERVRSRGVDLRFALSMQPVPRQSPPSLRPIRRQNHEEAIDRIIILVR